MGSAKSFEFVENYISLSDCIFGKLLAQIALEVLGLVQLSIKISVIELLLDLI